MMSDNKRILLIDDHQTVFRLLEAIVRLKGYKLLYAENGQQGIVIARQEQPDLILLDVMMPDIDSFRVCQCLKENPDTKHIPIMFLTASGEEGDLAAGHKVGADGFVTKPFHTNDVLKQIERILVGNIS
jgi:DNA-binding response OmpR family regulator